MKFRILIVIAALAAAMSASAGPAGVPADTIASHCDSVFATYCERAAGFDPALADSVPYLVEYARLGEPRALEGLAECYRYGRNGVKKSMMNAIGYYTAAGTDTKPLMIEAYKNDPSDEIGLLHHYMHCLKREGIDSLRNMMKVTPLPDYPWARMLGRIAAADLSSDPADRIMAMLDENSHSDEFLVAFVTIFTICDSPRNVDEERIVDLMARDVPMIANFAGEIHFKKYRGDKTDRDELRRALDWWRRADAGGMLDTHYIDIILELDDREAVAEYFSADDIDRLGYVSARRMTERLRHGDDIMVEEETVVVEEIPDEEGTVIEESSAGE